VRFSLFAWLLDLRLRDIRMLLTDVPLSFLAHYHLFTISFPKSFNQEVQIFVSTNLCACPVFELSPTATWRPRIARRWLGRGVARRWGRTRLIRATHAARLLLGGTRDKHGHVARPPAGLAEPLAATPGADSGLRPAGRLQASLWLRGLRLGGLWLGRRRQAPSSNPDVVIGSRFAVSGITRLNAIRRVEQLGNFKYRRALRTTTDITCATRAGKLILLGGKI